MEQTKVAALLAHYKEYIPEDQILLFKNALSNAKDEAYDTLMAVPMKSSTKTLLLSLFLGGLGVDRFYVGDSGLGVAKLLLGWITLGIWPLIDIFLCHKQAKKKNLQKLMMGIY